MKQYERWREIINILNTRRHVTISELMNELGVSDSTIRSDIRELSLSYPIYTKQGVHGGIFIMDSYRPYNNTLTPVELKTLQEVYHQVSKNRAEILLQIMRKYGPYKLEI